MFSIRTVMLFAGIFLVWKAAVMLWELRPVLKKKYTRIYDAKVLEVTEEHRSASMNVYYMLRFEYETKDGTDIFAPKDAVRPCRLKPDDEVRLCISEKGKFRTIRKSLRPLKATGMLIAGAALILAQILI